MASRGRIISLEEDAAMRQFAASFDFTHWADLTVPASTGTRQKKLPPQHVDMLERAAAVFGLIVFSPVMAAVALAIKIDSPGGPVFYRQERVGLNRRRQDGGPMTYDRRSVPGYGRLFRLWKFRTMVPEAEQRTGPVWAAKDDPRVTRVGGVLRKLRLDEIPQLLNVVNGDMRLIGPRPERPLFVEQLCSRIPEYAERLTVPPGITGLAQVERAYDASVDDVRVKVMYDRFYVSNWSRVLDLKIILKTIDVALCRRGSR